MDIMELVDKTKDSATVKRVFGEPIHHGDVTVIPVARVTQGGGGGMGKSEGDQPGEGGGGGFGLGATPAGVYVIKDGDVRWQPAIDVNRIVVGGQIVAVILLLTIRAAVKRWGRKH
ncbi:spore germination protein GerW family protein [Nonomuraea sp. NBC_01738]|uniref:GerW family sporulation protein n=1 Tax=Nonomuraea sp. NBC_01738 TaxID=2976003 RepID=UPI002E11D76A|nr:spore germination protein GerW family protein [Nonomuraea sp. NBC_01738]